MTMAGVLAVAGATVLLLTWGEAPRPGAGQALLQIDAATSDVTRVAPLQLPPFEEPADLAVGEGGVWVIRRVDEQSGGDSVAHLDPQTGNTVETIPVQVEPGTNEVAVGEGAVWVVGGAALTLGPRTLVTRVDPAADEVVGRIELAGAEGLGVAVGEGAVWVLGSRGRVTEVDPASGRAGKTIVVGYGGFSAIAAGGGSVWVLEEESVERIDPEAVEVVESIPLAIAGEDLAFGEGRLWVVDREIGSVYKVAVTEEPDGPARDRVLVGNDPSDITVAFGAVWVANEGDGTVSRIDPVTLGVKTIEVGGHPSAIAADTETQTIWVVRT
jgi:YVTN family beta-propeller protein